MAKNKNDDLDTTQVEDISQTTDDVENAGEAVDAPIQVDDATMEDDAPETKKKKRSGKSITAIVLLSLAIVLFLGGGAMGLMYYSSYQNLEKMKAAVDVQGFYPGITIDGQDVAGRSYDEVYQEFTDRQQAEADARVLNVQFEGKTHTLAATSAYDTEQVLVDAYNYAKEGEIQERYEKIIALQTQPMDLTTTADVQFPDVDGFAKGIAQSIDVEAVDATVGSFDAQTKTFSFTTEVNGRAVDIQELTTKINNAIENEDYAAAITPTVTDVPALITKEQLESQNTLLASFTTKTTSSEARNTNIRLCSQQFNGLVIAPGETISVNTVTGPRTTAKGYKPAGAILNGIMVQEPGGGVCQVSSTLFNAVVRAGMEIVERYGHSWPSDYVKIGMDATIDYPGKDLQFKNSSDTPVYLVATFENRNLTFEVYGKPTTEEGVTIDLRSTTDSSIERGDDIMVFDDTLAAGTNKTVRKGRTGKKATTYIQFIKDGKVIEEKVLFKTTYPAIRAIINYGPEEVYEEPTPPPVDDDGNVWP